MTSAVFQLCDDHVNRIAVLDPIGATFRGVVVPGVELAAGTDYGPEGIAARAELIAETLRRLETLPQDDPADRLAATHLRERLTAEAASHEAGEPFRSVRAPFGLVQSIRDSVDLMGRRDEDEWHRIADRLAAVEEMLRSWRTALSVGLERGLVAARRQAVESAAQLERYAGGAGGAGGETPPTHRQVLTAYGDGPHRAELESAIGSAHAAYAETAGYLRTEYAPKAVDVDGVGPERYALGVRQSLGADIDPLEAYEWGWAELRRIEAEMVAEAEKVRPGAGVEEATELLDRTEFVEGVGAYEAWLQERHDWAIAELNGTHFDIDEALRRVEVQLPAGSSAGAPYYTGPSEDLSRPGRTWWPIGERNRFETWRELTTVFHEGVPGHHLQIGAARVAGDRLSRFSRLSGVSGHAEGWALYAERLADELGWFTAPGTRLGMLAGSAIRAARVVIDIGVHLDLPLPPAEAARHGERWTFEVATDVLAERGRMDPHRVHPEVVRYCGWPGQAISYKLGERHWLAARDEARQRSGAAFDLKQWHTAALALGPIGLEGLASALGGIEAR